MSWTIDDHECLPHGRARLAFSHTWLDSREPAESVAAPTLCISKGVFRRGSSSPLVVFDVILDVSAVSLLLMVTRPPPPERASRKFVDRGSAPVPGFWEKKSVVSVAVRPWQCRVAQTTRTLPIAIGSIRLAVHAAIHGVHKTGTKLVQIIRSGGVPGVGTTRNPFSWGLGSSSKTWSMSRPVRCARGHFVLK